MWEMMGTLAAITKAALIIVKMTQRDKEALRRVEGIKQGEESLGES